MRIIAITLILVLALCLVGCTPEARLDTPVSFYYCVNEIDYMNGSQVFGKERRDATVYNGNLDSLLNAYFRGPESNNLYNPFPEGSTVLSTKQEGNILTIYLSEQFNRLPLEKLSLATACLVKTTFSYTSVPVVLIIPDGTFIDGSTYRTYTADSFLYSDENTTYSPPQ